MIGIRKPGQGYWVRVCSAIFWAAVIAFGATYAWNQAGLVPIPVAAYTYQSPSIDPDLAEGDVVTILRISPEITDAGDDIEEPVATGVIESYQRNDTGQGTVTVGTLTEIAGVAADEDLTVAILASEAVRLIEGDVASPASSTLISPGSGNARSAYPQTYLQAGAAGVLLLLGAIGILWTHGSNPKTTDFLIATDGEMRKVNWSTRKEIQGSTIVVIVATFLISAFLFAFDFIFGSIFRALDVLQS